MYLSNALVFIGNPLFLFRSSRFSSWSKDSYWSWKQIILQVPSFFVRKLVTQVFSFINVQLFNRLACQYQLYFRKHSGLQDIDLFFRFLMSSMLLRRECCTFSNGEYVKSGLCVLEKWIVEAEEEVRSRSCSHLYLEQHSTVHLFYSTF